MNPWPSSIVRAGFPIKEGIRNCCELANELKKLVTIIPSAKLCHDVNQVIHARQHVL